MSNTKHTPGPWTAHGLDNGRYSIVHNGPIAYCGDTTASPDDGRANASLIAAAPDLLAALESAFVAFGKAGGNTLSGPFRREWEECRSAIAKARGLS